MRIDKQIATIRGALQEAVVYFEERADAEYFTDSPSPVVNEEISRLVECREALDLMNKIWPPAT